MYSKLNPPQDQGTSPCLCPPACVRIVEALAEMKSTALDFLVRKKRRSAAAAAAAATTTYIFRKKIRSKKKLLSSFIKKQFNRASSHVIPMCENTFAEEFDTSHSYYDSAWTSIISTELECGDEPISGYLQWLEEKNSGGSGTADVEELNEIDRLAEKFIEMFHEKFRLEKQESYRRYQEMMARSI
uniref:DUF761 domain-containing protein n=1 Tax=Ananas comosus var. bracteatus TaxID=296719 RepID=A0A6V7NWI9_ANACO|nr:unnamed protein product [Ananas comosus var. bracteatus]